MNKFKKSVAFFVANPRNLFLLLLSSIVWDYWCELWLVHLHCILTQSDICVIRKLFVIKWFFQTLLIFWWIYQNYLAVSTYCQFHLKIDVVKLFPGFYRDWSNSLRWFCVLRRPRKMLFAHLSLGYNYAMPGNLLTLNIAGWNKLPSGQDQKIVRFDNLFPTESLTESCKKTVQKLNLRSRMPPNSVANLQCLFLVKCDVGKWIKISCGFCVEQCSTQFTNISQPAWSYGDAGWNILECRCTGHWHKVVSDVWSGRHWVNWVVWARAWKQFFNLM